MKDIQMRLLHALTRNHFSATIDQPENCVLTLPPDAAV